MLTPARPVALQKVAHLQNHNIAIFELTSYVAWVLASATEIIAYQSQDHGNELVWMTLCGSPYHTFAKGFAAPVMRR